MNGTPIIERAYELARSGKYASVAELDRALRQEGYRTFDELSGRDIRRRLTDLCRGRENTPGKSIERKERVARRPRVIDA